MADFDRDRDFRGDDDRKTSFLTVNGMVAKA